jgi:hypothetical protein
MKRNPTVQIIVRSIIAVGISLALLLSAGAPSDFGNSIPSLSLGSQ